MPRVCQRTLGATGGLQGFRCNQSVSDFPVLSLYFYIFLCASSALKIKRKFQEIVCVQGRLFANIISVNASPLSFLQHQGRRLKKVRDTQAIWLGLLVAFCLLASVFLMSHGGDAGLTNTALCEVSAMWLGFTFMGGLAEAIDRLPSLARRVVDLLRVPTWFLRFFPLDHTLMPVLDPVRAFILPPPAAPSFRSRV